MNEELSTEPAKADIFIDSYGDIGIIPFLFFGMLIMQVLSKIML